jgi:mannose-6-phosphate isomerase-like protein (cupin superfamily)
LTVYQLTDTESVRILHSSEDRLEVEATYGDTKLPPAHLHPAQDETFVVLDGRVRVIAGAQERVLTPGEQIEIPRRTPHRMAAADAAGATVRWTTRPALRTEAWFRELDAANRRHGGRAPVPVLLALIARYRDVFRLSRPRRPRNDSRTHAP